VRDFTGANVKITVQANQKGGVGKTFLEVQLAYFFAQQLSKRTLVLDFDHQGNTSKALQKGQLATVSRVKASQIFTAEVVPSIEHADLVAVAADREELLGLEKQASRHNEFATKLKKFLDSVRDQFDVCLIDTNPNPDIRQLAALVVSDFVISPLQLNQEAIDGIGQLLNNDRMGIRKIKAKINPRLELIGILPNMVEPTPFQRENFRELSSQFAKLLIPLGNGFAAIKKTTAVPEAQAAGLPVWKLNKTSAREAWIQIKPVFEKISSIMGVQ
jgi:chromosome partitioning protein